MLLHVTFLGRYSVLFSGGVILGWAIALYWLHPPTGSSDSAAWVQAIGSIAAIGASAALVLLQASIARRLAREQKEQQDVILLSAFYGLSQHALEVLEHVFSSLDDQTTARGLFSTFPPETIPSIEAMFDAFPVHQLPSKERVLNAFRLRGLLRVIRLFVAEAQRTSQAHISAWSDIADQRDEYLLALRTAVEKAKT